MPRHFRICCVAIVGFVLVTVAGCGDVPSTGDSVKAQPDDGERKKALLDGYMKKMPDRKGAAKAKN